MGKPTLNKISTMAFALAIGSSAHALTWYVGTTNANSAVQELAWQAAAFPTSLENFDSMAINTPLGNIASVNLTVRTYQDTTQALVATGGNTFTRSGSQFLWNTSHQATYFDANGPMTAMGYWAAGGDSDVHKVTVYDTSNNVLGVNFVTAEPVLPCFIGVTSNVAISSVMVEPAGSGGTQDSLGFDDVQTNAVPEPCSLALVGFALATYARRQRRQR